MRLNNVTRESMRVKLDYNNMMKTYVGEEGFTMEELDSTRAYVATLMK